MVSDDPARAKPKPSRDRAVAVRRHHLAEAESLLDM
jgi:hypothetical protein